ncbi:MAG: cupredoxin domain-containing protein [Ilumatobacteraceae bacterium]
MIRSNRSHRAGHRAARRARPLTGALLVVPAVALVLAACSGDDDSSVDDTTAPAATAAPVTSGTGSDTTASPGTTGVADTGGPVTTAQTVDGLTISNLTFSAATVTAGTEFTITNEDGVAHTVSDRDGAFDVQVAGGSTEPLTIERAGQYEIFCRIHSSMSGVITVV